MKIIRIILHMIFHTEAILIYSAIQFFFQSSAPAGSSVLWSFGDGDTSTAFTPKHVYLKSGLFKVTLTVNDDPQAIVRNIQIKSLLALTVSASPHGGVFLDRDTVHFIGTGALSGSMYIWSVYFIQVNK
jgi:hypothetical protein